SELFLVMEYIQGETLWTILDRVKARGEKVPLPIIAYIISGVLAGLHAAHEARDEERRPLNLVHRDMTPHNVIVDINGMPRVLDFGIAKAANRSQHTEEGQIKGKPAYMAPEQILSAEIDRRADVYAVCAILWEAVTQRRLFENASSKLAILHAVVQGLIEPPSKYATVAPELEAVIMRGLSLNANLRFPTALELDHALEKVIQPATQRQCAEWIASVVGSELAHRARMVEAIEQAAATGVSRPDFEEMHALVSGEHSAVQGRFVDSSSGPHAMRNDGSLSRKTSSNLRWPIVDGASLTSASVVSNSVDVTPAAEPARRSSGVLIAGALAAIAVVIASIGSLRSESHYQREREESLVANAAAAAPAPVAPAVAQPSPLALAAAEPSPVAPATTPSDVSAPPADAAAVGGG
ncbi:serine/threonine protein kinase, partial [bacterium]